MVRMLSFVLAVSLFVNIVVFVKWRELKKLKLVKLSEVNGATDFHSNPYNLKIIEPIAVTQLIGSLQREWWNDAMRKISLKHIVDKDFPEESPILIESDR